MKTPLRQLASESLIYGLPNIVSKMVAVFMVPMYTAALSEPEYGVVSLVTSGCALLTLLVILALDGAAHSWFWARPDSEQQRQTIATWFWTSQCSGLLLCVVVSVAPAFWAGLLFENAGPIHRNAVQLMAFTLPFNFACSVVQNWMRMRRRAVSFAAFSITVTMVNVGSLALFILGLKRGVGGSFEAMVVANLLLYVYSVYLLRHQVHPRHWSGSLLREMLPFCMPLVLAALPGWVLGFADRRVLETFHSTREVGLYHVGSQLAQGVALVTGAFATAWGPFVLSRQREPDHAQVCSAAFIVFLFGGGLLASGLAVFAPEILAILTPRNYGGAADVTGILSIGVLAIGLNYIACTGLTIERKSAPVALAYTAAAAALVAGSYALVPSLGRIGAAIASSASWLLLPALCFRASQSVHPLPFQFSRGVVLSVVFIVGSWLLFQTGSSIGDPSRVTGWRLTERLALSWPLLLEKLVGWLALGAICAVLSWRSLRRIVEASRMRSCAPAAAVETI